MSFEHCRGDKIIALGALSACASVALGAFAAHGLSASLSAELVAVFKTGVQYQAWHSFAILICGVILMLTSMLDVNPIARKKIVYAAVLFSVGIVCFSGSLYLLALTGQKWLGPITPLGGVMFLLGWLTFAWAALTLRKGK